MAAAGAVMYGNSLLSGVDILVKMQDPSLTISLDPLFNQPVIKLLQAVYVSTIQGVTKIPSFVFIQ